MHSFLSDLTGPIPTSHVRLNESNFGHLPYINLRMHHFRYYFISTLKLHFIDFTNLDVRVLTLQVLLSSSHQKLSPSHQKSSFPHQMLIPSNSYKNNCLFIAHLLQLVFFLLSRSVNLTQIMAKFKFTRLTVQHNIIGAMTIDVPGQPREAPPILTLGTVIVLATSPTIPTPHTPLTPTISFSLF